jgi:hypothetical protein
MTVVANIHIKALGVRELELTASDDLTPYNYRLLINESDYSGTFIVEYKNTNKDINGDEWHDIHIMDFFKYDTINKIVHNFPTDENNDIDNQIKITLNELLEVYKKSVATLMITSNNSSLLQPSNSITNYVNLKFGNDKLFGFIGKLVYYIKKVCNKIFK